MRIGSMLGTATFALTLAMLGGCGDPGGPKPPMGKVKGTVLYNGKPLGKVIVTFVPIMGKGGDTGQSASGTTESDGTFVLTTFNTGDGAIAGQHAVTVKEDLAATAVGKPGKDGQKHTPDFSKAEALTAAKPLVPAKYANAETSPLKYTVEKGVANDFSIELKD